MRRRRWAPAARPFRQHHPAAGPAGDRRRRDHGLRRQPWRIRRHHHLRLQHSRRDPHPAAGDLQRAAGAGRRGGGGAAVRAVDPSGAGRGRSGRTGPAPRARDAGAMSVTVALRHGFGGFRTRSRVCDSRRAASPRCSVPPVPARSTVVGAIAGLLRPHRRPHRAAAARCCSTPMPGCSCRRMPGASATVFQDARLFPHMSVEDNLRFGWRRAPTRAGEDEIDHVIALLGLGGLARRRPARLSGGEKGRVALGRALLSSPQTAAARRAAGGARCRAQGRDPALSRTPARRDPAFRCSMSAIRSTRSRAWPTT